MDTRLDYMDHASYTGFRAMGHHPTLHYTWVYDRPVDLVALQRLADRMHRGRLARLVEPSPIWGGRHRWVRPEGTLPLEVEDVPRPRSQVQQWSLEVSRRPLGPTSGPPWRFGVLPLEDGGSAVAIVVSHTVADNGGMIAGLTEALAGQDLDADHPHRGARRHTRWQELRELVGTVPEKVRAIVATLRRVRAERRRTTNAPALSEKHSLPQSPPCSITPPSAPSKGTVREDNVRESTVRDGAARAVTFVPESAWTACAEALGGTSNVLFTALAARLGQRLGRTQPDGTVNLMVPVSLRQGENDLRGNALSSVVVNVDPDHAPSDLRPTRAAVKAALTAQDENQLAVFAALPLVPLVPVWLLRRLERFALGANLTGVGCSNLGRVSETMMRIDGAPAQYAYCQFNEPGRPTAELARMGGQGFLGVTFSGGRVVVNAVAFRPEGDNTDATLLRLVHAVLDDFGLRERLAW